MARSADTGASHFAALSYSRTAYSWHSCRSSSPAVLRITSPRSIVASWHRSSPQEGYSSARSLTRVTAASIPSSWEIRATSFISFAISSRVRLSRKHISVLGSVFKSRARAGTREMSG